MVDNASTLERVFNSLPGAEDDPDDYATAAAVMEATGLAKSTVNDALRKLKELGRAHWTEDNPPAYRQRIANEVGREEGDAWKAEAEYEQQQAEATQDPQPAGAHRAGDESAPDADAHDESGSSTTDKGGATGRVRAERPPRNTFKSGDLQVRVREAVYTNPDKTWGIYEVAQTINAYPTSVKYALQRLLTKGDVERVQETPPRYRAAGAQKEQTESA